MKLVIYTPNLKTQRCQACKHERELVCVCLLLSLVTTALSSLTPMYIKMSKDVWRHLSNLDTLVFHTNWMSKFITVKNGEKDWT